jgi:hypothetical protein
MASKKVSETPKEAKMLNTDSRWAQAGWGLLLLGGLAHMLPTQMAPLLRWSLYGISVQMVVGVLSVVVALYFLLGNE